MVLVLNIDIEFQIKYQILIKFLKRIKVFKGERKLFSIYLTSVSCQHLFDSSGQKTVDTHVDTLFW